MFREKLSVRWSRSGKHLVANNNRCAPRVSNPARMIDREAAACLKGPANASGAACQTIERVSNAQGDGRSNYASGGRVHEPYSSTLLVYVRAICTHCSLTVS